MTRIAFIRHGSTPWNKIGKWQGSTDIQLDEEGILQAHKLGQRLAGEQWDIIYTSQLSRAKHTGEIIATYLNLDGVVEDDRLREISGGQAEGTVEAERVARWGEDWRQLELGLETNAAAEERGLDFIDDLLQTHAGKKILLVSHGAFIQQILRKLKPDLEMPERLQNTSLTLLTVADNQWECDLYNCSRHLD